MNDGLVTTVLIVDDDEGAARLLEIVINLEPDLQSIGSLQQADKLAERVTQEQPDIVLLDFVMPGVDPMDALKEIAMIEHPPKVLVYSGWEGEEVREQAMKAGAWGCVSKNIDSEELISAIRRAAKGERLAA